VRKFFRIIFFETKWKKSWVGILFLNDFSLQIFLQKNLIGIFFEKNLNYFNDKFSFSKINLFLGKKQSFLKKIFMKLFWKSFEKKFF
jgi:hypothetical protein